MANKGEKRNVVSLRAYSTVGSSEAGRRARGETHGKAGTWPRCLSAGLLTLSLLLVAGFGASGSSGSAADGPLGAALGRAREEGSYRFRSEVTQVASPLTSVVDAGRSASTQSLVLEGVTDIDASATELSVSADGGGQPLGLRIVDGVSFKRDGGGSWVKGADLGADQGALPGDLMGYLGAARDVVDQGVQSSDGRKLTRYAFGIDPKAFASLAAEQSQQAGRPASAAPVAMTGSGELWVDGDGLPVRQQLSLTFPGGNGVGTTSTQISVEFSEFGTAKVPGVARASSSSWRVDVLGGVRLEVLLALSLVMLLVVGFACSQWLGWSMGSTRSALSMRSVSLVVVVALLASLMVSETADAAAPARSSMVTGASMRKPVVAHSRAPSLVDPHLDRLASAALPSLTGLQVGDITTDTDGDGLTNFVEQSIGTDPEDADTDGDDIDDKIEVDGFTVACPTTTGVAVRWFGDPLVPDSNDDGVVDGSEWGVDSDGDCTPDVFDDDNDGDKVPDRVDTAPSTVLGKSIAFDEKTPLHLAIKGLDAVNNRATFVDFQVLPTDASQLKYAPRPDGTQSRLNWPADTGGQILDLNNTVDDQDVTLIPMLEIIVPKDHVLPSAADLNANNIKVDDAAKDGSRTVYVPLTVVRDPDSGVDVALGGRMLYSSNADWSAAQDVKLLWLVQVKNDVPCDAGAADAVAKGCKKVGDSAVGYIYNSPQIMQAYYEPWTLTGLTVNEEHGTDMAVIYEDPAADNDVDSHVPTWALEQVLTERMLSATPGTDTFEITTDNIAGLIDRDLNGGSTLYGLPNIFQVKVDSYRTMDEAVFTTASDVLPDLVARVFPPNSVAPPFMPLVTTAYSSSSRSFGLDAGSGYVDVAANAVTMSFTPTDSALQGIPTQTVGAVKWNPYCLAGAQAAWVPCGADEVVAEVDRQSAGEPIYDPDFSPGDYPGGPNVVPPDVLIDGPAPDLAEGQRQLALVHAVSMMTGRSVTTQITTTDNTVTALHESYATGERLSRAGAKIGLLGGEQGYKAFAGYRYRESLKLLGAELSRRAQNTSLKKFIGARYALESFSAPQKLVDSIADKTVINRLVGSLRTMSTGRKVGVAGGGILAVLGLGVTVALVDAQDDQAPNETSIASSTVKTVLLGSSIFFAAQAASEVIAVAKALNGVNLTRNLLGASTAKYLGLSMKGAAVSAVVFATITWGFFIYQMTNAGVTAFSSEFNAVLAETIATTLYIALLTVLSLTVVGNLVVALIFVVDAIIGEFCELSDGSDCATISSAVTDAITIVLYGTSPMIDVNASDLVSAKAPKITLSNPDLGFVAGNAASISVPVETTVTHKKPDAWQMAFYTWMYSRSNIQSADFEYGISAPGEVTQPAAVGPGTWDSVTAQGSWLGKDLYRATRSETVEIAAADVVTFDTAGLNQTFPYTLNSAYTVPTFECWTVPLPPPIPFVPVCYSRTLDDTTSSDLTPLVYDILPKTLSALLTTTTAPDGAVRLAWDPAFEPMTDVDGDGLLAARDGGLDPDDTKVDTDGDGLTDRRELELRAAGTAVVPGSADADGDGLTDLDEVAYGTDPSVADTDNDGLSDGVEARHADSAGGVSRVAGGWDITIASRTVRVYSDPLLSDSDFDGISDQGEKELAALTDPADRVDEALRPYHPGVVNTPPIGITLDVPGASGFVAAGDTVDVAAEVTASVALAPSVLDVTGSDGQVMPPALLDFDPGTFAGTQVRQQTIPFTVPGGVPSVTVNAGVRAWLPTTGQPVTSLATRTGTAQLPVNFFSGLFPRSADSTNQFVIGATLPGTIGPNGPNGPVVRMNPLATGERSTLGGDAYPGAAVSSSACNDEGTCTALWIAPSRREVLARTVSASGQIIRNWTIDANSEDSFSGVSVASDGQGFEAAWQGNGTSYFGLENPSILPFSAPQVLWAGDRYVVIGRDYPSYDNPFPSALLAYDTSTNKQIVLGQFDLPDSTRFAYDPAADALLVVGHALGRTFDGVGPIDGVLWSDFSTRLNCSVGCAQPTKARLFDIDRFRDDYYWGSAIPDVSFDPVSKQWVVGVTTLYQFPLRRTPTEVRYFGRTDLARGATWTGDSTPLNQYRNVACPAPSALPVVELGFEELPGATRFADSARPGLEAGAAGGYTAPQAGAAGAPDATRSHLAARFANTSDRLTVDTPSPFRDPTPVSLAFWVRVDPSTSPAPFEMAWDSARTLRIRPDTGVVKWQWGLKSVQSSKTLNDGNWHFVVATHSPTTLRLSVDGIETTTSAVGSEMFEGVPESMDVSGGGSPVTVDQLQFYNAALGTKAIEDLTNGATPQCMMLMRNPDQSIGQSFWTTIASVTSDPRGGFLSASASLKLRIDNAAPTSTVVVPSAPIGAGTYLLAGTANDGLDGSGVAQVDVQVDGGAWVSAEGAESWVLPLDLSDGSHQIRTRVTDAVGNSATFGPTVLQVDLTAPSVALVALDPAVRPVTDVTTGEMTVTLSGTASDSVSGLAGGRVEVRVVPADAGDVPAAWQQATVAGGLWSIDYVVSPTPRDISGGYSVSVRAVDSVGNATGDHAASAALVLDSVAPSASLSAAKLTLGVLAGGTVLTGDVSDDGVGVASLEVSFTPLESVVDPSFDQASRVWLPAQLVSSSWSLAVPSDVEGYFQIDLRLRDSVGNERITDRAWSGIVDTRAPRLSLTVTPTGKSRPKAQRYEISYACSAKDLFLDANAFTCPGSTAGPLVRGFLDPSPLREALMMLFPDQPILTDLSSTYALWESSESPDVKISACDLFGNCATNAAPVSAAVSKMSAQSLLPAGQLATLAAAPVAVVVSPTAGQNVAASGSVEVGVAVESDSSIKSVKLYLDGALVTTRNFSSGVAKLHEEVMPAALAAGGLHTVSVSVEDWGGATATSGSTEFFADVKAPTVTLVSSPITLGRTWAVGTDFLRFSGTVVDDGTIAAVQFKVGDGRWSDVSFGEGLWSTAVQVPGADGSTLVYTVRAIDLAGRIAAVGGSASVDLAPSGATPYARPDTRIANGPPATGSGDTSTFTFVGTAGDGAVAAFNCRLDNLPAEKCATPFTLSDLSAGNHALTVTAIDELGYTDLTPDTWTWSVAASGPQAVINSGPDRTTDRRTATFGFGLTGATFLCALDGGTFASCASPVMYSDLADGAHTFEVRALRDGTTGTAVSFGWRVVNAAPIAVDQNVIVNPPDFAGRAVTLVARDVDPVSYRIVKRPQHGFLEGTPPNITYVPFSGYVGTDRFTFEADDGQLISGLGTVDVIVQKVPATLSYTGTSGVASGSSMTLSGSVSPNVCSSEGIIYKVNGVTASAGIFPVTAGTLYEIEMSYSNPNCEAPSVYAIVLAGSTGDWSNGGGQYNVSGAGKINFGYTVQRTKSSTGATLVSGQMLWNSQNGKFRFKGLVTGFIKTTTGCTTGTVCGQIIGTGTLRTRDVNGDWVVVGEKMSYRASVVDAGSAKVCSSKRSCTTVAKPDFFGLNILGSTLKGEQEADPGVAPPTVQLSGGNIVIR